MSLKVPENIALLIVERMKEIINQDINFIDTDGIIIASTDLKRIGDYHAGAQEVLKLKEQMVINKDGEFEGARKGINLPVYFETEIVGVIGITGDEKEVSRYGKIIQSMTEILIKEAYFTEKNKVEKESRKRFLEEILFGFDEEDEQTTMMKANVLDVNLSLQRRVIVVKIQEKFQEEYILTHDLQEKIYEQINLVLEYDKQNILMQSGSNYIILFNEETTSNLDVIIKKIFFGIKEKFQVSLFFGIGEVSREKNEIRKSFLKAKKALNIALSLEDEFIVYFSDIDVGLIIDDLSKEVREQYLSTVFKGFNSNEINFYIDFLQVYFKNNGSIKKTSEELYLHKNTVQYQLRKIINTTGYDPRKTEDLVVLFLGVLISRVEKK